MAQLSETQLNIAKQIGAKELNFAKFILLSEKDNIVHIKKGTKFIKITYNKGSDLYDLEIGSYNKKTFDIKSEKIEGVYNDSLRDFIQNHFKGFEYVMDNIRIIGINA